MVLSSHEGYCTICERETQFEIHGTWLRDNYLCSSCKSIPRYRAMMQVIQWNFPHYKSLKIHEVAPGGALSEKLSRECNITFSQYYTNIPFGTYHENGVRSENLENLTFENESFDLFITQDVFEHVMNPRKAFSEIARVLRPGGAHTFTIPYHPNQMTRTRAEMVKNELVCHAEKEYHQGGVDGLKSLVVTDWDYDLCEVIKSESAMETSVFKIINPQKGIDGEFLDVFVSQKK